MTLKTVGVGAVLVVAAVVAVILGCSDKTFTSSTTAVSINASPTAYIPLEEGWRVSYVVLEPESGYFDIEVTGPVVVAGHPGYTIRRTDRYSGETTIFYRYVKDNAIFETQSLSQPGTRLLQSPFLVGTTWDRYDTVTTSDITDNGTIDDGTGETGGGGLLTTGPGSDYSTMSIVAIESVDALNGVSYGNCLKVAWQSGDFTINYFWYAPGIGLVKYEYNVSLISASSNRTLGVMSDYQHVEY